MNKMELTEQLMATSIELFKEFEQAKKQANVQDTTIKENTFDKLTVEKFISDKFAKRIGDNKRAKKMADNIKSTILNYYELSDRISKCPSVDDFVEGELIKIMDANNLTNSEKAEFLSTIEHMCKASTKEYFKNKLKTANYDEDLINSAIKSKYFFKPDAIIDGEPTDKDIRRLLSRAGEAANLSVLFAKPELLSDALKNFASEKNFSSHNTIFKFAEEANKVVMTEFEQQVIYSYALYTLTLDNKITGMPATGFDEKFSACYVVAGCEQAKIFYALSNRQITAEKAALAITMTGYLILLIIIKLIPVALFAILFVFLEFEIGAAVLMAICLCAMIESAEQNEYPRTKKSGILESLDGPSEFIYKKLTLGISKVLEFVDGMKNTEEEQLEIEAQT